MQLADYGVELAHEVVEFAARGAQRRSEEEDVPGAAEETVPLHQQLRPLREPCFLREGFLGRAVGDDLDGADEAEPAADLPDDVVAVELLQAAE